MRSGLPDAVDVVVLGGGAAGLMAASEAGRRGRRVIVLDHAERVGKKILISGGGRCNFTNLACRAENFISANPHFARSALAGYTPEDFVALVERHAIRYHEKAAGQLFCDGSAKEIVAMLERECREAGVEIRIGVRVIEADCHRSGFTVAAEGGAAWLAESVIVATGGLSIPKMGATGFGYELARRFGHSIVECRPGLVPLTFAPEERERWCDLAGVSAEVTVEAGKTLFRDRMLVTHKGLSGPAVLQASSYWRAGQAIAVDLAPGRVIFSGLCEGGAQRDVAAMAQAVRTVLPARWAERWARLHEPGNWTNAALAGLEHAIHRWELRPCGDEGYAKAEVTVGGVDTAGLDARTMQSRLVPGLFFVGEVVDVTGWLGGYNFQWAWASGVAAGAAA